MTEISKEYAQALFMLACEEGRQKEYGQVLEQVKAVFEDQPDYPQLLASPAIPMAERLRAVEAAFADMAPEHVLSYLKLLCEKGRIGCFVESAEAYKELLDASEHIANANITSAVELTEEEKQKLQLALERRCKGQVRAEYFVDKSLLGGMVVEVDGNILDGSLRQRLSEVKEVIRV
ncbi:MAG: ATP synthase F1 subunit delta [Oscillospiraceae bacterium]|nr:ATP synthase F1 subunit delta [Oscillospiraceae bacterium]